MLETFSTRWGYHKQALLSSVAMLGNRPLSTCITLFVLAVTLALPTLFWVVMKNVNDVTVYGQRGNHILLYLDTSLAVDDVMKTLTAVQAVPGVAKAAMTSPEEGLVALQAQEGMHGIMDYLPENPLPAVIDVTPSADRDSPQKFNILVKRLEAIEHVAEIQQDKEWVQEFYALLQVITLITYSFLALFALTIVLIIGNTLRIAVQQRREEVKVMKLMGARDTYIMRPFLYLGFWYGLFGAIAALLCVNGLLFLISRRIYITWFQLLVAQTNVVQSTWIIMAALILGITSAFVAVKKQLGTIESYSGNHV